MCAQKIIEITNGVTRQPLFRMQEPVNLTITSDGPVAIIGPNGGGKSMLVDILTGAHPLLQTEPQYDFSPSLSNKVSENLKYITFHDTYGDVSGAAYYQQRWNHGDTSDSPTIRELLSYRQDTTIATQQRLMEILQIDTLLDKQLIMLSSGELRRYQLAKALQTTPRVLIIDNPYIGLDKQARNEVNVLLHHITSQQLCMLILVVSRPEDIPSFITKVIEVKDKKVYEYDSRKQDDDNHIKQEPGAIESLLQAHSLHTANNNTSAEVIHCNHINISYGNRTILKDFCWTVNAGEKWALSGENGAGKSTLLSLVYADNPQGYACDITLFGKKRGSGESIWDIKKRIGYVSPEMYRAYKKNLPTIHIVASGLHDSVGLYKRPTQRELAQCEWWMDLFGISALKDRPYLTLSNGEQRLVLLVRAFVKDPELLILDEPLHGLDNQNRTMARNIIQAFSTQVGKTLIMVSHYEDEYPECITHKLYLKRN